MNEEQCNHVERPAHALKMNIAQKAQYASSMVFYVHELNEETEWSIIKSASLISSQQRERAIFTLAYGFSDRPDLASVDALIFFLELSVDAFLNHDFPSAHSFYALHLIIDGCMKAGGHEEFFQATLTPLYENQNISPKMCTPWGTPVILHPVDRTEDMITEPIKVLFKRMIAISNEGLLLASMLFNPGIKCNCLQVEDPHHERFGQRLPSDNLFHTPKASKSRAYRMECQGCGKTPSNQKSFKSCSRCKRARYCSQECQRAHWPEHKKLCSEKRAGWWGKAPQMSQEERRKQGLV
ncbi:hypothetical protein LEN26_011825 [Aphanomyces euteiches]|nr:hypothetical protein LEN26_011825 [Aphanomyces euteiches]KAH9184357.1 hypothetical protein AeNC1_013671 [Aphanomyces euteiches]